MKLKITICLALLLVIISGCASFSTTAKMVDAVTGMPKGTHGNPWWNDTVFYEIFVRSFYDSNGDGVGDFNGITEKLDYLNDGNPNTHNDLGVTGIWLMPINPSPSYHGYDVTDYFKVNPDYGTMDDFKNLLKEAHKRGIRVIIDMVLNHTSDENPWFTNSWEPTSPYHTWYIWEKDKPVTVGPWGEKVWFPSHGEFYFGIFGSNMPDLNYNNPVVTQEMDKVVQFWITEVGVDGFRLDAVKHLIEEDSNMQNTPETHTWLQQLRSVYKTANPKAMTIGEVAGENPLVLASYTKGDQLDLTFEFNMASAFVKSAKEGNAGTALEQMRISYKLIPNMQFAPFLTNHDQDRLMSQLNNDPNKVKVAASMLLTSPGVPFIYYGEEIGMEGQKPDEAIRKPMQWSGEKAGGFSKNFPWESVGADYLIYNVENESPETTSILAHYKALIQIRNEHAALRIGDVAFTHSDNPGLYSIMRITSNEAMLVVINLTKDAISDYNLSLDKSGLARGNYKLLAVMGTGPFVNLDVNPMGGFTGYQPLGEIPAYSTLIMQLRPGQ